MSVEGLGPKIFYYAAIAKLKTLRICPMWDDVDECHVTEILRAEPRLWAPVRVYRTHIFNDAGLAAEYELETLLAFRNKPGDWEWSGMHKSCGSAFFNLSLYKQGGPFEVHAVIIRTDKNQWRVYKLEPLEGKEV